MGLRKRDLGNLRTWGLGLHSGTVAPNPSLSRELDFGTFESELSARIRSGLISEELVNIRERNDSNDWFCTKECAIDGT